MSEWTECTLGDVVTLQRGYDLPSRVRRQGCYPVVSSSGTTDWHAEYKVEGPGVVTGRYGTIGEVFYVAGKYWPLNTTLFVSDFKGNVPRFVYYLLKLFDFKKFSDKSAVPGVNRNDLYPTKIRLPRDRETQESIALILHSLDDKIEHNNELIKMLEEQAQMVYDYWFTQFDFPDETGKPYRSSGGKMVWSEELKREIPEGWYAVTLNNICKMYQPQTLSLAELDDNADYFVYGANGIIGKYKEYNHSESEVAIACRGNSCGTVNRTLPNSWITGNAMVLQMLDRDVSNEFILRSIPHIGIYRAISGSGQPQITRENLQKLKIAYPKNNGVLLEYTKIAVHIVHRLLLLSKENMHLTAQRDFLLPLLMSGQVKVAE